MRDVRTRASFLATSALALGALAAAGFSVARATPSVPTASVASAHTPSAPGNPMLAGVDAPASPDDRRRWLRSRHTPSRYRNLRQSTGTHKQNRRRALAGR